MHWVKAVFKKTDASTFGRRDDQRGRTDAIERDNPVHH
jgi:hypothetical protein